MRCVLALAFACVMVGCRRGAPAREQVVAATWSVSLSVGTGSADLHFVDVDADGHLDLVSRHLLQKRIVVTRGDGRGGFATAAASSTTIEDGPGAMALGDLDGDGATDLVVATRTGGHEVVDVLLGRRDGSFRRAVGAPAVAHASAETWKPIVLLGDVDEDGALDVVTANGRRGTLEILRGDGRGGLGQPQSVALASDGGRFYLALGDVDGDGHLDLVASHAPESSPARVLTRRGDGKGGFADGPHAPVTVLANAALEALADVDGDGRPDVVLSHGDSTHVSVLLNRGAGAFAPGLGSPLDVGLPAFDAEVADVDGDGHADLVVATVDTGAQGFPSRVVVLRGDGRGFTPAAGSSYASGPGAYDVAVADVDADGRVDIAASSFEGDAVTLLLGRHRP